MKIPTTKNIRAYLKKFNPAGLGDAKITKNLAPNNANNHFIWLIEKGGKQYVLRIAKPKGGNIAPNIDLEYKILKFLSQTELAPKPHWLDNKNFLYPLLIEEFVGGKRPNEGKPSKEGLKSIARTLSQLHQLPIPSNPKLENRSYKKRLEELKKRLGQALRNQALLKPWAEKIYETWPRIIKFFKVAQKFSDSKPRVLLHGDLYLGNIIINKKTEAIIIDWQKPAIGDPTFDFGNIFVGIGWRKHYPKFKRILIDEYYKHFRYSALDKLFDLRIIERDITSIISELRDAAKLKRKSEINDYLSKKKFNWRINLIKKNLHKLRP